MKPCPVALGLDAVRPLRLVSVSSFGLRAFRMDLSMPDPAIPVRTTSLPDLYFLHIPKTAGTSFRLWLERLYAVGDFLPIDHLAQLEKIDRTELKKRRLASGHFGWRLLEIAESVDARFEPITVLREPVAQTLSLYRYATDIGEEDFQALEEGADQYRNAINLIVRCFHDDTLTVDEAFAKFKAEPNDLDERFQNMSVRFLALWGTEDARPHMLGRRELDLAKVRLERMRFFGLVEDWEETAILFADAFGLPLRLMDYRANKSAARAAFRESAFAEALLRMHSLDVELYRHAKAIFRERGAAVRRKFGLPSDAGAEEFRPALLRQFLETDRGVPRLRDCSLPLSGSILQDGFERRFPAEPGRWRLWSGPSKESTLYLPLDRGQPLSLQFTIDIFTSDLIRDGLSISVDGIEQDVERNYVRTDETWRVVFNLKVPVSDTVRQYSSITFRVPEVISQESEALAPATAFALGGEIVIRLIAEEAVAG